MLPVVFRLSPIQVSPQLSTTPQNDVGSIASCGRGVCEMTVYTPKPTSFTVQYSPFSSSGIPIRDCVQQFSHLVYQGTMEGV